MAEIEPPSHVQQNRTGQYYECPKLEQNMNKSKTKLIPNWSGTNNICIESYRKRRIKRLDDFKLSHAGENVNMAR